MPTMNDSVRLPQSESQWEKQTKQEKIPPPNPDNRHEMSEDDRKALHVGEHPADLSIREVSGWNSASEVKRAHYLTVRIIWGFYPMQELLEERLESYKILSEVSSYVNGHLEREVSEFPAYINDIDTKRGLQPPLGQATRLGSYTWTRHQQLAILNRSTLLPVPEPGASLGRRSLGLPLSMGVDSTVDSEDDFEMTNVSFSGSLGDMDEVCEVADYSFAEYEDSPRSETEDPVNIALMTFLSTLAIKFQRAKLDWDVNKKKFKFQLGNANIRTINDGCLRVKDNGDVLAVVEAKYFRLSENPEATLMQTGLDIVAHILDSYEKDYYIGKKFYMLSEHYDQIWYTRAEFTEEYIDSSRSFRVPGRSSPSMMPT